MILKMPYKIQKWKKKRVQSKVGKVLTAREVSQKLHAEKDKKEKLRHNLIKFSLKQNPCQQNADLSEMINVSKTK